MEKKQKTTNQLNRTKSKAVVEQEKREEGLTKAIDQNNKGFALLSKMGYKPGMGIGKKGKDYSNDVRLMLYLSVCLADPFSLEINSVVSCHRFTS